jgi:hypothetical protein
VSGYAGDSRASTRNWGLSGVQMTGTWEHGPFWPLCDIIKASRIGGTVHDLVCLQERGPFTHRVCERGGLSEELGFPFDWDSGTGSIGTNRCSRVVSRILADRLCQRVLYWASPGGSHWRHRDHFGCDLAWFSQRRSKIREQQTSVSSSWAFPSKLGEPFFLSYVSVRPRRSKYQAMAKAATPMSQVMEPGDSPDGRMPSMG